MGGGDPRRQRQGDERARLDSRQAHGRRPCTLLGREPAADQAEDGRGVDALAEPEAEARGGERTEAHREWRDDSGERPGEDAAREHHAAAEPIGQPAAGEVGRREAVEEDRLEQAHRGLVPAEFLHEERGGDGEVPPIHVAERETGEGEGDKREARAPHRARRSMRTGRWPRVALAGAHRPR